LIYDKLKDICGLKDGISEEKRRNYKEGDSSTGY
jgi:hypothetical protein